MAVQNAETKEKKALLFSFEDLDNPKKVEKTLIREFKKFKAEISEIEVSSKPKRANGYSFREIIMTMKDSQSVTFGVTKTGDVYQVKINKKQIPIKNQDDQKKAIKEIVDALDKGRAAWQKRQLAKTKVPDPDKIPGAKTARPKKKEILQKDIEALANQNQAKVDRTHEITLEIKRLNEDTAAKEKEMATNY